MKRMVLEIHRLPLTNYRYPPQNHFPKQAYSIVFTGSIPVGIGGLIMASSEAAWLPSSEAVVLASSEAGVSDSSESGLAEYCADGRFSAKSLVVSAMPF